MSQHAHAQPENHHEHPAKTQHEHAAEHAASVEPARAPVVAPEADTAIDALRPTPQKPEGSEAALVPMEPKLPMPKEPQSVSVPTPETPVPTELKDVRVRAEEALAAYVKESIPPELQKDLNLELLPVVGYGSTGIKLCFHGPHVTTNAPMLNEKLIGNNDGALTKHPVLQKFFHNVAQKPTIEAPSGASEMYHVIIPMSVEAYQNTLKELAGDTVQVAPAPIAAAALNDSAISEAAAPQNVVHGPVASLDKGVAAEHAASQGASL